MLRQLLTKQTSRCDARGSACSQHRLHFVSETVPLINSWYTTRYFKPLEVEKGSIDKSEIQSIQEREKILETRIEVGQCECHASVSVLCDDACRVERSAPSGVGGRAALC